MSKVLSVTDIAIATAVWVPLDLTVSDTNETAVVTLIVEFLVVMVAAKVSGAPRSKALPDVTTVESCTSTTPEC
jgi:hypothetical protein